MPRPLWSGALSFGLVNVPVHLVTATRDLDIRFHQLHEHDAAPIEVKRFCSEEGVEIDYYDIARAYELEDGGQVLLTDSELEAVAPERTRAIEIERFVDLDDVDPLYFSHPYFLEPSHDEASLKAYRLLQQVMAQAGQAALGRFVMRTKEYLAIVRERAGALTLETMRFATEIRPTDEIDRADDAETPDQRTLKAALEVIGEMSVEWEPDRYEDRYRQRLRDVVERKRKGEAISTVQTDGQPAPAPDLMAALETTLNQMRDAKPKSAPKKTKSKATKSKS